MNLFILLLNGFETITNIIFIRIAIYNYRGLYDDYKIKTFSNYYTSSPVGYLDKIQNLKFFYKCTKFFNIGTVVLGYSIMCIHILCTYRLWTKNIECLKLEISCKL